MSQLTRRPWTALQVALSVGYLIFACSATSKIRTGFAWMLTVYHVWCISVCFSCRVWWYTCSHSQESDLRWHLVFQCIIKTILSHTVKDHTHMCVRSLASHYTHKLPIVRSWNTSAERAVIEEDSILLHRYRQDESCVILWYALPNHSIMAYSAQHGTKICTIWIVVTYIECCKCQTN